MWSGAPAPVCLPLPPLACPLAYPLAAPGMPVAAPSPFLRVRMEEFCRCMGVACVPCAGGRVVRCVCGGCWTVCAGVARIVAAAHTLTMPFRGNCCRGLGRERQRVAVRAMQRATTPMLPVPQPPWLVVCWCCDGGIKGEKGKGEEEQRGEEGEEEREGGRGGGERILDAACVIALRRLCETRWVGGGRTLPQPETRNPKP